MSGLSGMVVSSTPTGRTPIVDPITRRDRDRLLNIVAVVAVFGLFLAAIAIIATQGLG